MMDLLQSDGWERFQRALGRRTHRVDGALAIEMPLPFGGTYLYSPRGSPPIRHCEEPPSARLRTGSRRRGNLTSSVQRLAREAGAIFWRGEFPINLTTHDSRLTTPLVLRRAVEPEWTWQTSLARSDDERLAAMHEKHRYNVRLAERRGVRVDQFIGSSVHQEHIEAFWRLLKDTAKRQGIATHPRAYYETMIRVLPGTLVYLAERQGIPVAAAIVAYHGDIATYLHGGSSYEHRALMAPHLLHWRAMRDAKAAGMRWYDFGGIEPPKTETLSNEKTEQPESAVAQLLSPSVSQSAHAWAGMTRFKQGFGGEAVHHPPMRDLVFRPGWYRLLSFLARLRN